MLIMFGLLLDIIIENLLIMNKHQYTVETLYHFTCGQCQMWWSWASTPMTNLKNVPLALPEDESIFCPHCGTKNTMKVKEGFVDE